MRRMLAGAVLAVVSAAGAGCSGPDEEADRMAVEDRADEIAAVLPEGLEVQRRAVEGECEVGLLGGRYGPQQGTEMVVEVPDGRFAEVFEEVTGQLEPGELRFGDTWSGGDPDPDRGTAYSVETREGPDRLIVNVVRACS